MPLCMAMLLASSTTHVSPTVTPVSSPSMDRNTQLYLQCGKYIVVRSSHMTTSSLLKMLATNQLATVEPRSAASFLTRDLPTCIKKRWKLSTLKICRTISQCQTHHLSPPSLLHFTPKWLRMQDTLDLSPVITVHCCIIVSIRNAWSFSKDRLSPLYSEDLCLCTALLPPSSKYLMVSSFLIFYCQYPTLHGTVT